MSEHQRGGHPLSVELQPVKIGRYVLHRQIARGGMATVHIARLIGDEGFTRIVAAKRLLPELAENFEFLAMFLDEAEIASRIHHCNVVPVLDVVTTGTEAVLIQEYVYGVPLHWLLHAARRTRTRIPVGLAVSIACQALAGLHAAHETRDELGMPLNVVHRDVSPHNLMIAFDGTLRLLDFGIAKAVMAAHLTQDGQFKGKLAYAAPEQLRGQATRQSDLYSLAAVLWELVVGHDMHHRVQTDVELLATVMTGKLQTVTEALGAERRSIESEEWRALQAIEPIIKIGLSFAMSERWGTAADMEQALVDAVRPVSRGTIAMWLKSLGAEFIDNHDRVLAAEEVSWRRIGATMRYQIAPVQRDLAFETCVSAPPSRAAATYRSSVRQLTDPRRYCRRPAPLWHLRGRFRP
jgi:eukaryotic-like serine/threonine-protein kinase